MPLNKGVPPTESMAPTAVLIAEANKETPDAAINPCPVQLHSEADISPAQEEATTSVESEEKASKENVSFTPLQAAPKQSAKKKRGQKPKAGAKKSGKEQAVPVPFVEEKAAEVSLRSMGAERSSSSACPVRQVQLELVKTIEENGDSGRQAPGHANGRADMALPQQTAWESNRELLVKSKGILYIELPILSIEDVLVVSC